MLGRSLLVFIYWKGLMVKLESEIWRFADWGTFQNAISTNHF